MLKIFETFSGIGSQRLALKNIGVAHEVVATSEWDVNSLLSYDAIHNNKSILIPDRATMLDELSNFVFSNDGKKACKIENLAAHKLTKLYCAHVRNKNLGSIKGIEVCDVPDHDLLTYSFPCQSISTQGKMEGFDKNSNTSSSLVWEIERLLIGLKEQNRLPKYLVMENVAEIFGKKFMPMFKEWIKALDNLGYETKFKELVASDFGYPQTRKRAFAVSVLGKNNFIFPLGSKTKLSIGEFLESSVHQKYYLPDWDVQLLFKNMKYQESGLKIYELDEFSKFVCQNRVYHHSGFAPTITADGAQSRLKIVDKTEKIRFLTAKEHWLLMGFTENDFLLAQNNQFSDSSLKKQAGNSICIGVLEAVFSNMLHHDYATKQVQALFNQTEEII